MEELLLLEPQEVFNDMIIGVSYSPHAVVYDKDKLVEYWTREFARNNPELTQEEAYHMAIDHFEFNTAGSYMGEHHACLRVLAGSRDTFRSDLCRIKVKIETYLF